MGYKSGMADEIKHEAAEKLEQAPRQAKSDAVRDEIGSLPPAEIAMHAQAAIANLRSSNPNLAAELEDLIRVGQVNPDALKRAVIGFVEIHPETIAEFAPKVAKGVSESLDRSSW